MLNLSHVAFQKDDIFSSHIFGYQGVSGPLENNPMILEKPYGCLDTTQYQNLSTYDDFIHRIEIVFSSIFGH